MRVLKGRQISLTHSFLDEETPLDFESVSATLTDPFGIDVATVSATKNTDLSWQAVFPTQPLGEYMITWDAEQGTAVDVTGVEIVGGFLFSVPAARASDDYLSDKEAFPAKEIVEYREVVEEEFQRITGRSFTTRLKTLSFYGDGGQEYLHLIPDAQAIESVTVNGSSADPAEWQINGLGKITAPTTISVGTVVIMQVRYGHKRPPLDVARAGMVRLRSLIAAESSGIPDRATTWQPQEGGTLRQATPGQGRWKTGIPEVDSTLQGYTLDVVLSVYGIG